MLQKHKLGYLIAGIGAIIGLIGAFALPYITGQVSVSAIIINYAVTITDNLADVAANSSSTPRALGSATSYAVPLGYGILWLAVALVVVGLIIALVRLFTNISLSQSLPLFAIGLIVVGVVSLVIEIYVALDANNKIQQSLGPLNGLANGITVHVSGGYGAGGWLFLLGTLAVIAGGVMGFIFKSAAQPVLGTVPAWPPAQGQGQGQAPQWSNNDYPAQNAPTQYGQQPYQPMQPPQPTQPPQPPQKW